MRRSMIFTVNTLAGNKQFGKETAASIISINLNLPSDVYHDFQEKGYV